LNAQRALWPEIALREFAYEVSGPQALAETRNLENLAADFLCDLAHLADPRGWKLVDLLRVARARYDLATESRGEQFDGFEQLMPPAYGSAKKRVQSASLNDEETRTSGIAPDAMRRFRSALGLSASPKLAGCNAPSPSS